MTTSPFPDLTSLARFREEAGGATLDLTIDGHTYTWDSAALSLADGIRIRELRARQNHAFSRPPGQEVPDAEVMHLYEQQRAIGERLAEPQIPAMAAAGVTLTQFEHVAMTLLAWHMSGREAALDLWMTAAGEEAPARPPAGTSTTTAGSSTKKKPSRSTGRKSSSGGRSSKPGSTRRTK